MKPTERRTMSPSGRCLRAALATAILVGAALAPVSLASAQTPDSAAKVEEAKRLFTEGETAFAASDFAGAERSFEASMHVLPSYDTATNLAVVEMRLGKWREAAEHLDVALRTFPPSESKDKRDAIQNLLVDAKSHVAILRIKVNVPGATVSVNGAPAGKAPLDRDVYADPGDIVIKASAPGHIEQVQTIKGEARFALDISFELAPAVPIEVDKPLWPVGILGGVAAAGLAVGIAGFVLERQRISEADELAAGLDEGACGTSGELCGELEDHLAAAKGFAAMGGVGFAIFGAAGVGALVYALVPAEDEMPEGATPAALSVVPLIGTTNGVVVTGAF